MGKEVELMREMWRLGGATPDGVTIPCRSNAEAVKLRFTLYNAVRVFRDGREEADHALRQAIDGCQITIGGDFGVTISQRIESTTSRAMLELLQARGQPVRDTNAVVEEESLQRVMEKVAETQRLLDAGNEGVAGALGSSANRSPLLENPGSKYGARG